MTCQQRKCYELPSCAKGSKALCSLKSQAHTHTHMYVCQISKVLLAAGTVQHTRNWRFTCKQEEVLEKAVLRDGWSLMSVLLCVLFLAHWLVFVPKEQRKELTLLSTSGRLMMCSKLFSVAVHCSAPSSVNETDNHTCRTISSPHYYHHSFFSFNKSETRMTASVLKQDPDTWKVQRNSIYYDKTQHVNFGGKPQRLKGILFIMTKHNMWILECYLLWQNTTCEFLGVSPHFKLQNSSWTTVKCCKVRHMMLICFWLSCFVVMFGSSFNHAPIRWCMITDCGKSLQTLLACS